MNQPQIQTQTQHQCLHCHGAGLSRRGGPCKFCRGTGTTSGIATVSDIYGTIVRLAFSAIFLVVLIAVLISVATK